MEQLLADEGQTEQPVAAFAVGAAPCHQLLLGSSKVKGFAHKHSSLMIEQQPWHWLHS